MSQQKQLQQLINTWLRENGLAIVACGTIPKAGSSWATWQFEAELTRYITDKLPACPHCGLSPNPLPPQKKKQKFPCAGCMSPALCLGEGRCICP